MSQSLNLEIQALINVLRAQYNSIKSIEYKKSDQNGIYLVATHKNNEIDYLRFKIDGKLVIHRDGAWHYVKDYLFKSEL